MNVQAPSLSTSTSRRAPVLVAIGALVSAAAAAGAIAISTNNDDAAQAPASRPAAITKVDTGRVWDGSPILRGTAVPVKPDAAGGLALGRVWDGSPILRGTETSSARHPGGEAVRRFQQRPPEGFHSQP